MSSPKTSLVDSQLYTASGDDQWLSSVNFSICHRSWGSPSSVRIQLMVVVIIDKMGLILESVVKSRFIDRVYCF